jgi:hypothetical protein
MTGEGIQTENLFGTHENQTILVYIDESGDSGLKEESSKTYTLGCVMVEASNWSSALNILKNHRRGLKSSFGIQLRREVKSNYLMRGSGDLTSFNLSPSQRSWIFRSYMRMIARQEYMVCFSVVVHKDGLQSNSEVVEKAWTALLQRLERTSQTLGQRPVLIIHDSGDNDLIRRILRWSRVQLSAGQMYGNHNFRVPFETLIEDAIPRDSRDSYFVQLADIVAYTAFRRIYPGKQNANSIVKTKFWEEFGNGIFRRANQNNVITAEGIVEIK